MGRRRKRNRRRDWEEDEEQERGRRRRERSRQWHEAQDRPASARAAVAEAAARPKVLTCHDCSHLVITRSIVKYMNQPWDRANSFPSLSCFEVGWTLDDPDSVPDPRVVTDYLVEGADQCPHFARGYPRDHRW